MSEPRPERASRFPLVKFNQLQLSTERKDVVKGLIPRDGLSLAWGPPKCGKSFWSFDLSLHVAQGWAYRDRPVLQGPVVYAALEGQHGFGARAEAFRRKHMPEEPGEVPFYLMCTPLDLIGDHLELIGAIHDTLGTHKPVLVVIDTLSRSLRGSESSDDDMAAYIRAADVVRDAFKCAVLIVHHCGIDDKRPRGHTSLTGAADCQISVRRDADGVITAKVEWLKDGPEGAEIVSRLEVVELGPDSDGDTITSCVIVEADRQTDAPKKKPRVKLPPSAQVALRALTKALCEAGSAPNPGAGCPPSVTTVVPIELWRSYAYAMNISTGETRAQQKAFERATDALQAAGVVCTWRTDAWLV